MFLHIVGARPQFMKLSPLYDEMVNKNLECKILHTGQHFDTNMSDIFFEELGIPKPHYNLNINSLSNTYMTSLMMKGIEDVLVNDNFHSVIVYGDTNSTLAGALVGRQLNLNVIHIESGVRNNDEVMPEETNRIITDRISDILFCVSPDGVKNLQSEGCWYNSKIYCCGDLMYDSVLKFKKKSETLINNYGDYVLVTIHRASNTDDKNILREIVDNLNEINKDIKVVFPIHPRTKNMISGMKIDFELIEPVGYVEMLNLINNSKFVITDSGGVVRESYWFKKPSLLLLDKPLWPELIEMGVCVNTHPSSMMSGYNSIKENNFNFIEGIYGDGKTSEKITKHILENMNE